MLLATKLHVPVRRSQVVSRADLLRRLLEGSSGRLTLVDAPPGWGKTTLLAEWSASGEERRPFVWVSLDRGDNDPTRFWTYVVEALRRVEPKLGTTASMLLRAPGTSLVEDMLPTLINDAESLPSPVVLVLDDYHVITSKEIHDAVAFLVEHLPETLHLVLATRSDPPLPLARLRAGGELLEIRAAELAFSEEEAAAFMNDAIGLGLEPSDVALLYARTEGWAAGLHLAALSLGGRGDARGFIKAFAGDDRHVVDYLGAEVLDRQPEPVRRFLLRTSILERLCGPLCDAVMGTHESARTLEEIDHANLFLVPLDTKRHWYRYHQLFGELLRFELERTEPGLVAELHRRASAWHRNEGTVSEAIHHATAAGDIDVARDLVARHWNAFVNEGRVRTAAGWLEALPDDAVLGDPRLCLARAWMCPHLGRIEEVETWLDAAERGTLVDPIRDGASSIESSAAMLRASHRHMLGDVEGTIEAARRAAELEREGTARWRTVAHANLGVNLYWRGETAESEAELEEAVRLCGNNLAVLRALGCLAAIRADEGDIEEAGRLVETAMELLDEHHLAEYWVGGIVYLVHGKVLEHRGSAAEAEIAVRRGLELAMRGRARIESACGLLALAEICHGRGDAGTARESLRKARRAVGKCPDPGILAEMLSNTERRLQDAQRKEREPVAFDGELSDRELAVLRLLPTELSQRDIGRELYVSLNTVKTHAKSIFRKLGVSRRSEAVTRARELGLL